MDEESTDVILVKLLIVVIAIVATTSPVFFPIPFK